ncbi:LppP/LprE family lipoprotein [Nocardia inohanensis]|uniref:LppP/LprE family lipoprotein n=1 Tax=Nocardia inohanensis TaxID=209246 RepID=UPI00082D9180|nr:LppP/LprE family lipoprotein [Nocardia inohanensis]
MKCKSAVFAVLAAGVMVAASGCGDNSTTAAGGTSSAGGKGTSVVSTTAAGGSQGGTGGGSQGGTGGGSRGGSGSDGNGSGAGGSDGGSGQGGSGSDGSGSEGSGSAPVTQGGQPNSPATTKTASPVSAPNGSGHGLCFDVNSGLANEAVSSLKATTSGGWKVEGGSGDAISDGCDGVMSYMYVSSGNIHPYYHVLYFTGGKYLGTATLNPFGYTEVLGKTRTSVTLRYRWIKSDDALCCPSGGPSDVVFTLNGTKVTANGQFPPN